MENSCLKMQDFTVTLSLSLTLNTLKCKSQAESIYLEIHIVTFILALLMQKSVSDGKFVKTCCICCCPLDSSSCPSTPHRVSDIYSLTEN